MNTSYENILKIAKGRVFSLRRSDYIFVRVAHKTPEYRTYNVFSKAKPPYLAQNRNESEEVVHSSCVKLEKLPENEETIKTLFDLFEVRKSITFEKCPYIITFYDQGIFEYGGQLYYATRYDDTCRNFGYWIHYDHDGMRISALDCYRLLKSCLEAFAFLEENNYILTRFDHTNIYAGSMVEDRLNFFRLMFIGHKKEEGLQISFQPKYVFPPPETGTKEIYKSYVFSLGVLVLYALYKTNNLEEKFLSTVYANILDLPEIIKNAIEFCYPTKDANAEYKELLFKLLEDMLKLDVRHRKSARDLLKYKWMVEYQNLDLKQFKKDFEENEKALQKEKQALNGSQ